MHQFEQIKHCSSLESQSQRVSKIGKSCHFFKLEGNCFTVFCVGFCHTSIRISHRYTHVPSLVNLPLTSHPSRLSQSTSLSFLHHTANFHSLYFTYGDAYASMLVSLFIPPSPSPTVSTSLFPKSASPLLLCK